MSRTPSLNSLRLFLRVANSLSFSDTARQANLSQPALSRTIKLLEEELDIRLFDRNSRNVSLTPAGAALRPTVERLLTDFDQAFLGISQTFQGLNGRVFVGALPSIAATILPQLIAEFREERPHVDVIIREDPADRLLHSLRDRLIDFAVSTAPPFDADLDFDVSFDDPCVLVCRRGDLPTLPEPVPWTVFDNRPFVCMGPSSSVRALTDAALARAGVKPGALFECGLLATAGGAIAAGLGLSLMPRSTLPLLAIGDGLAWREMAPPTVSRHVGVCRMHGRTLSPAANAFFERLIIRLSMHKTD